MSFKEFFGAVAVILTFVGYAPYFWALFKRRIKPHMFSWIIWAVVSGITSAGQYSRGAGAGSWMTGFTAFLCFSIFGLSIVWGEKNITKGDWAALASAFVAIALWCFAEDPLGAVILATIIDAVGLYPTLRKSYHKPYEESVFAWAICCVRSFLSLVALEHYSTVTVIFPLVIGFLNGGTAVFLLKRRALYPDPHNHKVEHAPL